MEAVSLKLEVDTSEIDVALAKAGRLKATLERVKTLQAEIAPQRSGATISFPGGSWSQAEIDKLSAAIDEAFKNGLRFR